MTNLPNGRKSNKAPPRSPKHIRLTSKVPQAVHSLSPPQTYCFHSLSLSGLRVEWSGMEPAKIDWKRISSTLVVDDLYEDINAPKFVDFSAPDEPVDDEAWFCRPGMSYTNANIYGIHVIRFQLVILVCIISLSVSWIELLQIAIIRRQWKISSRQHLFQRFYYLFRISQNSVHRSSSVWFGLGVKSRKKRRIMPS